MAASEPSVDDTPRCLYLKRGIRQLSHAVTLKNKKLKVLNQTVRRQEKKIKSMEAIIKELQKKINR